MRNFPSCTTKVVLFLLSAAPSTLFAQTTHVVQVMNNFFQPANITIQAGDTVRWENTTGHPHNVLSQQPLFYSGQASPNFIYEFTFTQGGEFPYFCQPHQGIGMTGSVTVEGSVETPFNIDPGHTGTWWGGEARAGEGAQIEVANAGGGDLVFVMTMYSYGPVGGQIFLIAVGTPDGGAVDVDVFITDGGVWGEAFDPDAVNETQWGTGTFTAESCDLIHMSLTPNQAHQTEGYSNLEYDLVRLTNPAVACPYEE